MVHADFESEKNRKALLYTTAVCAALLLICWLITWPQTPVPTPLMQDLIEVNLGNNYEGFGEEQPLIKGEMSPQQDPVPATAPGSANQSSSADDVATNDDNDPEAAAVPKKVNAATRKNGVKETNKTTVKNNSTVIAPTPPKPRQPKYAYQGPGNGNGNGANEDNGFTSQGNTPKGKGDAGDPSGKPDSYGNTTGGSSGGPKVIGNRKIIKYYSFTGDLDKATVYALVKVSPSGTGTFMGFGKNSTTRAQAYANAIIQYLRNVQFDKAAEESIVIVQFNFKVQ